MNKRCYYLFVILTILLALMKAYLITGFLYYVTFIVKMQIGMKRAKGTEFEHKGKKMQFFDYLALCWTTVWGLILISIIWPVMYSYYKDLDSLELYLIGKLQTDGMTFEGAMQMIKTARAKVADK